jgi:hypothetical protein
MDDRGFEFRQELGIFLFTTVSRPALSSTQPPIQLVPGSLSLRVKQPGHEAADNSPPSSAEVKECMKPYLHSQYTFIAWCSVKKEAQIFRFMTSCSDVVRTPIIRRVMLPPSSRCHDPEDHGLNLYRRENLKSQNLEANNKVQLS